MEASEFLAEIRQPNGVMKNSINSKIVGIRTPNNAYDGKVLTVSPSNGVQYAKATHSEGHNTSSNTTRPGIPIGGIPSIELVAAPNVGEPWFSNQVIEKREIEVAGNGEHIFNADLDKAASDEAAESGIGGGRRRGRVLGGSRAVGGNRTQIVVVGFGSV